MLNIKMMSVLSIVPNSKLLLLLAGNDDEQPWQGWPIPGRYELVSVRSQRRWRTYCLPCRTCYVLFRSGEKPTAAGVAGPSALWVCVQSKTSRNEKHVMSAARYSDTDASKIRKGARRTELGDYHGPLLNLLLQGE